MEDVQQVPLRGAMVYTQRNRRRTPACVLVAMLCVATDEWTLCVQRNPPEVKKPGGGLGMLERPDKRGDAEGP